MGSENIVKSGGVAKVSFVGTYSKTEGATNHIDNLTTKGIYKGNYGILYVMPSSGIIYQILENVDTNGYNLTFRKKENGIWSSNSIFDDRLHLPVIKVNGSLIVNKDSISFSICYIYFNYRRTKSFSSTLPIEGNGIYRIIADHSTTTITCFLLAMSSDEYLDLAGYTTIGIINVVNGVIENVLINAIGNVIYNNKINVDNKIEVNDSVLLNTGYYIGANGALTSSEIWKTWLIKAKKGDIITATLGSNAIPEYMIAAYGSQKFSQSFIEGTENKATTSTETNNYEYSVTEDSFVLVSNRNRSLDPPIIHHYTNVVNQEEEDSLIISTYSLFSGYLVTGTSWSTDPKKAKYIKIPVSFGERYAVKAVGDNINYAFLSSEEGATSIDWVRHTVADGVTDTVIVPYGASYLYVQLFTGAGADLTENIEIVKLSDYVLPTWQVAQHDLGIMDIEYSVLSGAPGNSIAHFERAVSDGFKYLKADMRITSDGYIVLCHDAGYTFNDDGRIISYNASNSTPINTLTLAEVKALEFASQVAGEYVHPCSLEEFLVLCKKHGITPYLTVRPEDYALTIPESTRLLKKFALDTVAIYNLYVTKDALWSMCRAFDEENSVLRCYTIHRATDVFDESQLAIAMEMGCAYIDIWKAQEPSLTDAMWEIISKQRMRILSIGFTESDFDDSVQNGIVGFQNNSRNKFGS